MCIYIQDGTIYTFTPGMTTWMWCLTMTHAYTGETIASTVCSDESMVEFKNQAGVRTLYEPPIIVRR